MARTRLILGGLGLVAVAAAAVFALQPFQIGGATISFGGGSTSKKVMTELGLPDPQTGATEISLTDPDGTMPEIAMRSFSTSLDADAVRSFYRDRCTALELAAPSEDLQRAEPDALCFGRRDGRRTTVLVAPKCAEETCDVTLQVRVLVM